jgi:YD repeat-containing protein
MIPVVIFCFLAVVAVAGVGVYRFVQRNPKLLLLRGGNRGQIRLAGVQHGGVARTEELHAHGKLYFVPVGRQTIPVELLAAYYREKFKIEITVLPPVTLPASACIAAKQQCIAEEVTAAMTNAYPEIAQTRTSAMIALTDEDIFPQSLGFEFTYSLHSARFAVISTHRMDPAFWGDPPNEAARLASTKQMLTKYIALVYFHLPESFDPTSIMYTPLTPNGGPDDIYESDLRSDESANGLRGTPFPCIFLTYSYETHTIKPDEPALSDCAYGNPTNSTREENFSVNLGWGSMRQRNMDLQLDSTPAIRLTRFYNSGDLDTKTFGPGSTHTFNAHMTSNGFNLQTFMEFVWDDGSVGYFKRMDNGRGFNPATVYESHDDDIYGARIIWDVDHYKLLYRDGAWSTILACADIHLRCYWNGYQDAKGHRLQFDRGPKQELQKLTAGDRQGITFHLDDQQRTIAAMATNGKRVTYGYDPSGCLAKVRRADGQITLYTYDPSHHMTSMSVVSGPGARPKAVITSEYDAKGRVTQLTLAGVGAYKIQYAANNGDHATAWKVTTPEGKVLSIFTYSGENLYIAHSATIRFPAVRP